MTSNNKKNNKDLYRSVSNSYNLILEYAAVLGRNRLLSLKFNKIYATAATK